MLIVFQILFLICPDINVVFYSGLYFSFCSCFFVKNSIFKADTLFLSVLLRHPRLLFMNKSFFFNLILDGVMIERRDNVKQFCARYRKKQRTRIWELTRANYMVVFGKSEKDLQRPLKILHVELQTHNMKINNENTKAMIIGAHGKTYKIRIDKQGVEQVRKFTCLQR